MIQVYKILNKIDDIQVDKFFTISESNRAHGHKYKLEASAVQWLCHSPCKAWVAGSIPGFSSPSDGTIDRGPVSI